MAALIARGRAAARLAAIDTASAHASIRSVTKIAVTVGVAFAFNTTASYFIAMLSRWTGRRAGRTSPFLTRLRAIAVFAVITFAILMTFDADVPLFVTLLTVRAYRRE